MAMFNWMRDWVEFVVLFIFVISVFLSFASESLAVRLIIVFIVGLMFGRIWFVYKKRMKFALSGVIIGFLFGFLLGNFFGNIQEIILVFLIGFFASYYLHSKKLLRVV